jgi:hypothetical protein
MANRYWVGGAGTWDNASTANWSATSGGASGASAPTVADVAIFNTASAGANYTVTVAATAVSLNTTVANPTGGTVNLSLSGAPTLCTAAGTLTFTSGTITLNNNNLTVGIFSSSNSNTRSIAFGTGNIVLSSTTAAATVLDMATATGFTTTGTGGFSRNQAATATINFGATTGGSATNAPNLSVTAGASTLTIATNSWFNNTVFTGSTCTVSSGGNLNISGNLTLGTGTYNATTPTFRGTGTFITNGRSYGGFVVNAPSGTVTLGDAVGTNAITVTAGTLTTSASNYSISLNGTLSVNGGTLTLNGSTVSLNTTATPFTFTSGTINAGTSQINMSVGSSTFAGGGQTYYNVSFTSTAITTVSITGANTFNNLTIAGKAAFGISNVSIAANQTINGTLTLSAGADATARMFLQSDVIGTIRTLTCAAVASPTDIDFRDITIAGAAAPVSGTRLGNCGGNSGITFGAGVNKYWNLAGNNNWSATAWALSAGGAVAVNNFPLAQDTTIFTSTSPATGATTTINTNYNIGTIDMSARTSNTMTLAMGAVSPLIYGNWINGTGTTISGSGSGFIIFAGDTNTTITSSGRTLDNKAIEINKSPSASVTLQDALTMTAGASSDYDINLSSGIFNSNNYNVTLSNSASGRIFWSNTTLSKTLAIGTSTWTVIGTTQAWNVGGSNLTITGTGTISMGGVPAKTFIGGGFNYGSVTLNQGGAGALTITGSNTFGNITNTIGATNATSILFTAGTTNTFNNWNANGTAGRLLTIGSATAASHTLSKASGTVNASFLSISRSTATGGAIWRANNSINGGFNTGWIFPGGGNFMAFFM